VNLAHVSKTKLRLPPCGFLFHPQVLVSWLSTSGLPVCLGKADLPLAASLPQEVTTSDAHPIHVTLFAWSSLYRLSAAGATPQLIPRPIAPTDGPIETKAPVASRVAPFPRLVQVVRDAVVEGLQAVPFTDQGVQDFEGQTWMRQWVQLLQSIAWWWPHVTGADPTLQQVRNMFLFS
jgi:hypothetical protein